MTPILVGSELQNRMDVDGFAILGRLDPTLLEKLVRASDTVGERCLRKTAASEVHLLSCLDKHPDLVEIVDWPPLLAAVSSLLSSNIYVHHSHLDIHPPHERSAGRRWHRDGGVQGREMRLMPVDQPRLSVKAGVFLTDVLESDDGAFEVVPGSHRDRASRPTDTDSKDGLPLIVSAGSVVLFDSRLWHRRRDNVGRVTRKALFCAYTYRWIAQRDEPFDAWPNRHLLSPLRRQLVGDRSWDAFYPAPGVLPLDEWIENRGVPMTGDLRPGAQLLLG